MSDASLFIVPDWMKRLQIEKLRELVQVHPVGTCFYCDYLRERGFIKADARVPAPCDPDVPTSPDSRLPGPTE